MSIDHKVDEALDRILKASGSALKHYTMPATLSKLRAEMLSIMKASYIEGSNDCHKAITEREKGYSA